MAEGNEETAPLTRQSEAPLKRKLLLPGMIGGIMLIEAVVIFTLVRVTAPPPAPAHAEEEASASPEARIEAMDTEVVLAECDAINRSSGQAVVVHLELSALVSPQNVEHVQKLVEKRKSSIQDRVQLVVRAADPKHLNEPGTETLRQQLKAELDKILGDDKLLGELIIPRILQTRSSL